MGKFWKVLGKGLVKVGGWALGHPEELLAVVTAIQAAKDKK